ncbi:MAG TPA: hypothetical protein VLH58_02345 [Candidatus Methylomirabilis sp.]|nr:hypothetical protein [Candidatus Methylomirabilis sp.]HSB77199.1 hypothetical protein [Candidatus Methylomirabilis sp.]HSC70163.1 hypothetical protein [Candidatus Methylomirabilis sp.]
MKEKGVPFSVGVIVGILISLLIWKYGPTQPKKTSLKLTGLDGKATVEFSVEGDAVDYQQVLDKMFTDEFLRRAAIGWLADKQKLFPLQEERLATAIASELCDPIPDTPLKDRLEKAKACAEKPMPLRLRALAADHRPPFHYIGVLAKAGLPGAATDRPQPGQAHVCRDGGFYGKRLQLINPRSQALVVVKATNYYRCTGFDRYPNIQLSSQDAKSLFGSQPLANLEDLVVVPLQ